jgi:hypothetical protein
LKEAFLLFEIRGCDSENLQCPGLEEGFGSHDPFDNLSRIV